MAMDSNRKGGVFKNLKMNLKSFHFARISYEFRLKRESEIFEVDSHKISCIEECRNRF